MSYALFNSLLVCRKFSRRKICLKCYKQFKIEKLIGQILVSQGAKYSIQGVSNKII